MLHNILVGSHYASDDLKTSWLLRISNLKRESQAYAVLNDRNTGKMKYANSALKPGYSLQVFDGYYPEVLNWAPKDFIKKMTNRTFDVAHRKFSTDTNGTKLNILTLQRLNTSSGDIEVGSSSCDALALQVVFCFP